jgi:hypothetical protein
MIRKTKKNAPTEIEGQNFTSFPQGITSGICLPHGSFFRTWR